MKKSCICILVMLLVSCGSYPSEDEIIKRSQKNDTQPSFDQSFEQVIQTGSTEIVVDTSAQDQEEFKLLLTQPLKSLKWFRSSDTIESSKTIDGMARLIADLPEDIGMDIGNLPEKINEQIPIEVTEDNYQDILPNIDLAMLVVSMANQAAIDQGFVEENRSIDINQVIIIVQTIAKIFELFSDDGDQSSPLKKLLTLLSNPRLQDIKDNIESILRGSQTANPDQIFGDEELPDLSVLADMEDFQNYEGLRASYAAHTEYVYRTYEDFVTRSAIMSMFKVAYSQKYAALVNQ